MVESKAAERTAIHPTWNSLRVLDRVIPLAADNPDGSLRLEGDRLVAEADGRALALDFWPGLRAYRRGQDGAWLPTERWADELLASWPALEPGSPPAWDPFRAFQYGRRARQEPSKVAGAYWPFSIFLERIPAEARAAATQFTVRRWHLLRLFAEDERLTELGFSNPALALALASVWRFRPAQGNGNQQLPVGISGWKRRRIAAWLGFPETEAAVRKLKLIEPRALTLTLLQDLRDRMKDGELNDRTFGESGDSGWTYPARMIKKIRGISRALGERLPSEFVPSIIQTEKLYLQLSNRLQERTWNKKTQTTGREFGMPPFPGNPNFEPIKTEAGLYAEGLEMHNCLPWHASDAVGGHVYFYKVLKPVRATLMVERTDNGDRESWAPGDIRAPKNGRIPSIVAERCFRALFETAKTNDWLPDWEARYCYEQAELPWKEH